VIDSVSIKKCGYVQYLGTAIANQNCFHEALICPLMPVTELKVSKRIIVEEEKYHGVCRHVTCPLFSPAFSCLACTPHRTAGEVASSGVRSAYSCILYFLEYDVVQFGRKLSSFSEELLPPYLGQKIEATSFVGVA
jgi:hypothetical protein